MAYLPSDLDENSSLSPETMSGGEKQMIALLRALHANKGLLLLDEPFAALSKEMSEKYTELLLQQKDLTILMITHDKRVNYLEQFQQIWQVERQNIKIIVDEKN
ncbi:ATP-binding cassette domain-containing protein [Enterococcus cecorum]|uniref:ATP-binding cassette domain-containing protein n=1 Tax=Enterococcus cecorum TaxID=44008 RepID=UPI003F8DF0EF